MRSRTLYHYPRIFRADETRPTSTINAERHSVGAVAMVPNL